MSDTVADEKKEKAFPPKNKANAGTFPEHVTVKRSNDMGKTFSSTTEGVSARRTLGDTVKGEKDQKFFVLKTKDIGAAKVPPGSEIVDSDGFTYTVIDSPQSAENTLVQIKKKP